MPTLEEIAKAAKVSRSTVSRVVNNDPNVSDETRRHVQAVVQRLNYHPNMAARSLVSGRTRILGLVIPMGVGALFSDPYFPILIQGVSSACNALDYSVMLWLAEPEYERRMISQLSRSALMDGVIVASMLTADPMVTALKARGLPFVLVGRHPSDQQVSYVDVDNVVSAREAVAYLQRLGHRRIAAITGPQNMIAGADRLEGYVGALRAKGLMPQANLIAEGDFTEDGGHHAMQRLLPSKPDAVFASSDTMAVGALRAIHEAGLRVPADIALVGFDDMPFAARTDPPLTTVRQPIRQAGSTVAEALVDLITHPDSQPRRIVLPTELVIRASSGPAVNSRKEVA